MSHATSISIIGALWKFDENASASQGYFIECLTLPESDAICSCLQIWRRGLMFTGLRVWLPMSSHRNQTRLVCAASGRLACDSDMAFQQGEALQAHM